MTIKDTDNDILQNAQAKIDAVRSQNPLGEELNLSACGLTDELLQVLIEKDPEWFDSLIYVDLRANNLRNESLLIRDVRNTPFRIVNLSGNPLDGYTRSNFHEIEEDNSNIKVCQSDIIGNNVKDILYGQEKNGLNRG